MIKLLDLTEEWKVIGKEVESTLTTVLRAGHFILGSHLAQFEKEFSVYLSQNRAQPSVIGCASGTEAITLSLRALGIGQGHKVATVANTCTPTAAGIRLSGADLVLMDVDPIHLLMDPDILESQLKKTRLSAVVAVSLYGNLPPLDSISELCRKYDVRLIEDCAQSHGAELKGRKSGTFGDAGAFSFYPSKNLGAYGDAGAVVTFDEGIAQSARNIRNYGYAPDRRDYALQEGLNSRLDEMQAAILSVKLPHLNGWNQRRREIAALYDKALRDVEGVAPIQPPPDCLPSRHLYVVRCGNRDLLKGLLEENGIPTQIHYPWPLHLQPAYRFLNYSGGDFPNAESAAAEILSLPLHPFLMEEDVARIISGLKSFSRRTP